MEEISVNTFGDLLLSSGAKLRRVRFLDGSVMVGLLTALPGIAVTTDGCCRLTGTDFRLSTVFKKEWLVTMWSKVRHGDQRRTTGAGLTAEGFGCPSPARLGDIKAVSIGGDSATTRGLFASSCDDLCDVRIVWLDAVLE